MMKCFCLQNYWNIRHPLTEYCTSISTLPTFQCSICASPQQSMVDYIGHFMTHVKLSFCRFFSSYECKNEKWPTCCGVNFRLYQNMSNFMINYESVSARPQFRLNPQPDPYNPNVGMFCDKIKLSDSCRWKYEYTHGDQHLALILCATCKTGISTLSLRINEHPYWIKLRYVQSTHTCVQIYCGKYHFKQFNNKWVILKKCALLTGGLEVSFSIHVTSTCTIPPYLSMILTTSYQSAWCHCAWAKFGALQLHNSFQFPSLNVLCVVNCVAAFWS